MYKLLPRLHECLVFQGTLSFNLEHNAIRSKVEVYVWVLVVVLQETPWPGYCDWNCPFYIILHCIAKGRLAINEVKAMQLE